MSNLKLVSPMDNQGKQKMPSKNGYVHLWRDIKKQPFYKKDFIARGMFVDMLLDAQHASKTIQIDGVNIFLNSSQLFTKRKHFVDQGIDDSKVRRTLEKFEKLGIITRETIKVGNRSIGQRITFLNWNKWQKIDQSIDQPSDQPQTANIKGLNGYSDQPSDQPIDQECNNDSNKEKRDMTDSSESVMPVLQDYTKERLEMFEAFWSEWRKLKNLIGNGGKESKQKAKDKFLKIFNASHARKLGVETLAGEVDDCIDVAYEMHTALHSDIKAGNNNSFHPIKNMQVPAFLEKRIWRGEA